MKYKYIVIQRDMYPEEMIVFPVTIGHDDMARAMNEAVVSAGFVDFAVLIEGEDERVNAKCFGESTSLGLHSREEDTKLFNSYLKARV